VHTDARLFERVPLALVDAIVTKHRSLAAGEIDEHRPLADLRLRQALS